MLILIFLLVSIAGFLEGLSDRYREKYQLYVEDGGNPREYLEGRFWGYIPFNPKKIFGRDGWHFLKFSLFGAYIVAICLATWLDFNWWLLLLPVLRWIFLELALKVK